MSNIIKTTPALNNILNVLKAYTFPGNIFYFKALMLDSDQLSFIPYIKQNETSSDSPFSCGILFRQ